MPSKVGWAIRAIEVFMIVLFLLLGGVCLFTAFQLESQSLPSESPATFFQSLYNGSSNMGAIEASLSPNSSFVVGANITAQIKIDLSEASSEAYQIKVIFLDAIVIRDSPPYTWQQDWTYSLHDVQINGTEQIQTLGNVTLVYAQEGIYGLNMTITQASTNTTLNFHFDNLVQIKPLSYIEEKFRSNVTFALTYGIFGLSFIMVATAIAQLIEFFEKILGKPQSQKSFVNTTAEDKLRDSKMSEDERQGVENKEIDLMKIQICADRCHTVLVLGFSLGSVLFAFWGIYATVFFQGWSSFKISDIYVGWIGMTVMPILAVIVFWISRTRYDREFSRISKMMNDVQEGKHLSDLDKLYKRDD
jgi:hypothetical protein